MNSNVPQGLTLIENAIDCETEEKLLTLIDEQVWSKCLKRDVQHYGFTYSYSARNLSEAPAIPLYFSQTAQELGLFTGADGTHKHPTQVIVNRYQPGQGITAHCDHIGLFSNIIASLTLGSGASMVFTKKGETYELFLPMRSLVVLSDDARYYWKHAIPARKSDKVNGMRLRRGVRTSITYRTVIEDAPSCRIKE